MRFVLTVSAERASYRAEWLIDRDGIAVYHACNRRLGRWVTLKLLAPELSEEERSQKYFLSRFWLAASVVESINGRAAPARNL
jgi:hypothetical protein